MTFKEVREIMKKCKILPTEYLIDEPMKPLAETALCLDKKGGKFRYYVLERNVVCDERIYNTESEACKNFLTDMKRNFKSVREYFEKR